MPARRQQAPPASGCPEQERAGRRALRSNDSQMKEVSIRGNQPVPVLFLF